MKTETRQTSKDWLKRDIDFVLALCGLVLLTPAFLVIALIIKLGSRGPVFYRGTRVGRHGRLFDIFKFRTMVTGAEKMGGPSTADDDPRVTKVGRSLRKRKLDELPQLLNILKGEMSFVGPRPEVSYYVNMFTDEEKQILNVRPGITDWASLWNSDEGAILAGSEDPEKTYMEKIRPTKLHLQLEYVRHHSLQTDFKILLQTLGLIVFKIRPDLMPRLEGKV